MRTAFLAFLALVAGSAANAAEPPFWHVLPEITAFSLAAEAASRNTLAAQIDMATSTTVETAAVRTIEWWTINRPFAKSLMQIPTNQVQAFPVYCVRVTSDTTTEHCYGPFPAK